MANIFSFIVQPFEMLWADMQQYVQVQWRLRAKLLMLTWFLVPLISIFFGTVSYIPRLR